MSQFPVRYSDLFSSQKPFFSLFHAALCDVSEAIHGGDLEYLKSSSGCYNIGSDFTILSVSVLKRLHFKLGQFFRVGQFQGSG